VYLNKVRKRSAAAALKKGSRTKSVTEHPEEPPSSSDLDNSRYTDPVVDLDEDLVKNNVNFTWENIKNWLKRGHYYIINISLVPDPCSPLGLLL
jgi:hypothetical protein